LPDRLASGIYLDVGVGKASDTSHSTEIMVEGTIFCDIQPVVFSRGSELVPCMNNTTCSMDARESADADCEKMGYIAANAESTLFITVISGYFVLCYPAMPATEDLDWVGKKIYA
jgi:hypothetical protein